MHAVRLILRSVAAAAVSILFVTGTLAQSDNARSKPGAAAAVDRSEIVDLGTGNRSPDELKKGLFPEDSESAEQRSERERCERLVSAGFKCMPPARSYVGYVLPGVSFAVGSADLPELMKQQLRSFADALRGRTAGSPVIRVDGHADGTGTTQTNIALSQRRAESVRDFLVSLGVSPTLLQVQGHGANQLRNPGDPAAAENRRVEIARNLPQ